MDALLNVRTPPDTATGLSRAQKRDLLGMSAAAVITAALIAAPAVIPREAGLTTRAEARIVSPIVPPVIAAVRVDAPLVAKAPERGAMPVRRTSASPAVWIENAERATPVEVVSARMDSSRKPLVRKLAGFFTGDGTHAVRPFPSVPADRH